MKKGLFTISSLLLLLIGALPVLAQKAEKVIESREVVIPATDSTILARVYVLDKKKKLESDKTYYWLNRNMINENQGTYLKNPLHGRYCVLDRNNKLIEQGLFKFGLKNGLWRRWYSNGNLKESFLYRDGVLHGESKVYLIDGTLDKSLMYKNGLEVVIADSATCKKPRFPFTILKHR